ncbi:MAG: pentapeptide repeat-containing protein [Nodosilinea sp.]
MELSAKKFNQLFKNLSATVAYSAAVALGVAGATTALMAAPVKAENAEQVTQLLVTGACQACDLTGADLTGEHLIGVDLRGADLTGATLANANLEGADLTGATLVNTNLSGAFLTNAVLDDAIVSNVDFSEATLVYTSLEGADIDNVNLVGAEVLNTPISIGGSYEE